MGKHYIPRFYLKGFTALGDKNQIFRYSYPEGDLILTNTINVAQENDFYSEEIEKYLANEIEEPANEVISKVRKNEKISKIDKQILTNYMVVIMKRVPAFQNLLASKYPEAIKGVVEKTKKEFVNKKDKGDLDENEIDKINNKIYEIGELFTRDEGKVKEIWESYLSPETSPRLQSEILNKQWIFLTSRHDNYFITSDNPFFFFSGIGLKDSEISFPLSKDIALVASRTNLKLKNFATPPSKMIKEINKRSIYNATEFIFSSKKEVWLPKLIQNRHQIELNSILMNITQNHDQ